MAKAVPPNSRDKDAQYVLYSTVCLISICYMRCVSRCVGVSVFVCVSKLCSGVYYVLFVCNFTMHLAHTFYVIVCFFLLFLHVCKSWYAHCTHTHTHTIIGCLVFRVPQNHFHHHSWTQLVFMLKKWSWRNEYPFLSYTKIKKQIWWCDAFCIRRILKLNMT